KTAEEIMTAAERLRREGRQEGEARGQVLGKQEILLRLLRQRFGSVPATTVARVVKAGAAELDRWADRVLLAESLDAVLGTKARRKA
ncbi:MAG: transposase, partial [Byssovorax sp.]